MLPLLFLIGVALCTTYQKMGTTSILKSVEQIDDLRVHMLLQIGGVHISGAPVYIMGTIISTHFDYSSFSDSELELTIKNANKRRSEECQK